MRLQSYLAKAGIASRRNCEELITQGRVRVNSVIAQIGCTVQPGDTVELDGRLVEPQRKRVLLFNKPKNVICTAHDPQGRVTVLDYFKDEKERLFTVGRLDYDSEGALLLTNDGELANALAHPRNGVEKEYFAVCEGEITPGELERLEQGVQLSDGPATARVKLVSAAKESSTLYITIREGRNRQVRRMLLAVGHRVLRLKRVRVGPIELSGLENGKYRELMAEEIERLKQCATEIEKPAFS